VEVGAIDVAVEDVDSDSEEDEVRAPRATSRDEQRAPDWQFGAVLPQPESELEWQTRLMDRRLQVRYSDGESWRIETSGISGGRSLTGPLRDARRFPSTRW
jgi:hypothetical protein